MADPTLLGALSGLQFRGIDSPYGIGAQALAQATPALINPYGSVGSNLGITLGSTLIQALLGYQARQDAAQQSVEALRYGNQLMAAQTPEERLGIIESVPSDGWFGPDIRNRLVGLNAQLGTQDREVDLIGRQMQARELAGAKAKLAAALMPEAAALRDIELEQAVRKAEREAEITTQQRTAERFSVPFSDAFTRVAPTPSPIEATEQSPFGPMVESLPTVQSRRNTLIQEGIRQGLTPNAAAEYAEKTLKSDTIGINRVQKVIDETRQRAADLQQIAATAQEGVRGAGATGGPAAWQALRGIASSIYGQVSPEEAQQRASEKLLDSVGPQIAQANRSPGAVSDFEFKLLIGAGPSSWNTPEANEKLIRNMERLASLENEYADFMESFLSTYGTVTPSGGAPSANSLWQKYKEQEVFKNGQYNPDRVDVFSFLQGADSNIPGKERPPRADRFNSVSDDALLKEAARRKGLIK